MKFDPVLSSGTLIKRYKRFLADIELPGGEIITIHCPNTGSMKNCNEPGSAVLFSDSGNPKRKYRHTWEAVAVGDGGVHWAGINTGLANKLVQEALQNQVIAELRGYESLRTEVKYGNENSRIDLLLEGPGSCFVEVKNVTLGEGETGYFPDAVTERGRKHLRELAAMVAQGYRAVLLFCVQHTGVTEVRPADHIDPGYGETLRAVLAQGVEAYAYQAEISAAEIRLVRPLSIVI